MDELLALIGQHWRLILIYPGGLTALGAMLLVLGAQGGWRRGLQPRARLTFSAWLAATIWLLLLALLPLPQAGWPYDLDLIALLLAIELPFWLWQLRPAARADTPTLIGLLAPPLNVYPLLVLAVAALGQATGSLVVHEINRSAGLLHWVGLGAWSLTLPPLLHLGPWRLGPIGVLRSMRQLAHLGLLLAAALPAHDSSSIAGAALGFVALGLPLLALDRWWRGAPERWIGWQPWLVAALLLLVAALSGQQLAGRLR